MVKTTCPYCGVGCGVLAQVRDDGTVAIKGDPAHPANYGRLCSKGAALADTLDLHDRLLTPRVRGQVVDWETAIAEVAGGFGRIIHDYGPEAVAFYVSGQLLTEDYYLANKLIKGFIGSANIDTNSRLCMASTVVGYKRAFGSDTVPCNYEDLEQARLVVLVGANAAWCHPVLFQRLTQARQDNPGLKVVVIDPRRTPTCDIADLHLAVAPGSDVMLFNGLLAYLAEHGKIDESFVAAHTEGMEAALATAREDAPSLTAAATACGLTSDAVRNFYEVFAATEQVVTVFSQGVNQSSSGSDKVNAIINCHLLTGRIGRAGMGPFSFTGQPNAMGGREVGGLANQLAAHMELENSAHRALVQQFWGSPRIPERPGYKAVELFEAIAAGKVKAVWIMATNPAVSLPDADRVRAALKRCELVVVSDVTAATDTAACAHVLLPAAAWAEKDGTVTNSERRISRQRAFLPLPGEVRPDWWIMTQVARRMGFGQAFPYETPSEIFREHAALTGHHNIQRSRDLDLSALASLTDAAYDALQPVQWPVTARRPQGTSRLFSDHQFFTPNKRARLVAVKARAPVHALDAAYGLVLNTGRVRDHWHTLTRTGKAARLSAHITEPYVEIHPRDAAGCGVEQGGLARVGSRWGEIIVRVRIGAGQRPGSVFVPMHWSDQFAGRGRADAVVNPAVDPLSGEPEFKYTPVKVAPYVPAWYGFLLSRRRLPLHEASYWALSRGQGMWRYELAGEHEPANWAASARALLCAADKDVGWVEYFDRARHHYRAARLVGGRLESCIFIGPDHKLPPREWLEGLFALETLNTADRVSLLSGLPPRGQQDGGCIVCACFNVGRKTLVNTIRAQQLATPEAVGRCLKAGTNCGSCLPEIKGLLAEALARAS